MSDPGPRAWTVVRHVPRDPGSAFELRALSLPPLGDHQVHLRCEGFGLNFADVMAAKGLYRDAPPPPSVPGYEVVGRVVACGKDVPAEMMGRRVLALTRFGGYATDVHTDHRAMASVPHDMPLGEALALGTQGCTAWYAARILCPLRKGERVLVHSAAGGVGQLLVQLALDTGCEVFAMASGQGKAELLKAMGVHHVLDRRKQDHAEAMRKLLGKGRLDVSFNAVGGSTFKKDMSLLGGGGRIVLYGGAERSGLGPLGTLRFVWRMGLAIPIFLMMKSQSLLGLNMLRISESRPEIVAECLHAMVRAHAQGVLKPHVHRAYASEELPQAIRDLADGGTMGKLAVHW